MSPFKTTTLQVSSNAEIGNALTVVDTISTLNHGSSDKWYTAYQQTSANDLVRSNSTLETPNTGLSTIQNIIALSQVTYDALTIKKPETFYIIV